MSITTNTHFAQFYQKYLPSLLLGHKQICDTGDEATLKIHKKIKIGMLEIGLFSATNSEV